MAGQAVVGFYDRHPISESQILDVLRRRGQDLGALRPEDLFELDQDHYGGIDAVAALAERVRIGADSHVLDVCAGLGGPARYLAWRFGCRVTGIDITPSRCVGAAQLTELVGLSSQVEFVEGDATALPFADGSFTACISQEGFAHIADKPLLLSECRRVLGRGSVLGFTDWVAHADLGPDERSRLDAAFAAPAIPTLDDYRSLILDAGFEQVVDEDLSAAWVPILKARLELYRSLRDDTVARFGEAHSDEYERNYAFFVGLVEEGRLGGGRFVATR